MDSKVSVTRFMFAVIIVNATGTGLKYFELDTFVILLGFRFHLSAVLPLLLIIKRNHIVFFKDSFLHPAFKDVGKVILTFLFSSIIFLLILYLTGTIEAGDPDYFYEFGLSSIVDYPIYLIWNSIQLIFLYFFFTIIYKSFNGNNIVILISAILIFAYEIVPANGSSINYQIIAAYILLCVIISVTIEFFNNVYLFVVLIFSTIWFSLLAFGSTSSVLINLFFAAKYRVWEGFFAINKAMMGFVIPANYLLVLIILLILLLKRKRNFT